MLNHIGKPPHPHPSAPVRVLLAVNVTHTPAVIIDDADCTRPRVNWQRSVDTMVDLVDDLG